MTTFIALLRGINASGHNIIRMAELKALFEELGFESVKTYIQSGNVLFLANGGAKELAVKIEKAIAERFGLAVPVVIRTAEEFDSVIANSPYPPESLAEGELIHVAFLSDIPSSEAIKRLEKYCSETEEFTLIGKNIYLLLRKNFHTSKLPPNVMKLGVHATLRNWRTTVKLAELARTL
ncbi:hypothetical protein AM500_02670 [Bacillus sp. FJAT-18017]|uniref:DUF1697 domain-containing protein n=1 Tax=Bacillus sp. FJAT-18017 TaxID=1705566 RepID=UPI0006AE06F7|nr:DUF1697 domain-containing protein [Bacillus sp. FJAT-18017]ALC88823.1 hypothetical protein AM500_02670 [Bacillus sp. FJAT-18017]